MKSSSKERRLDLRPLHFWPSAEERQKEIQEALEKIDGPLEKINYRIAYLEKLDDELDKLKSQNESRQRALERTKRQEARERVAIADLLEKAKETRMQQWAAAQKISPKLDI